MVKRLLCGKDCASRFYREDQDRKDKIGKAFTGPLHPAWKGGISQINSLGKRGTGWNKLAEFIREGQGRLCRNCGKFEKANGRKLDVHHLKPFHDFKTTKAANHPSNLEALCKSCHRRKEHATRGAMQMILGLGESMGRGKPCRGESVNTNKLTEAQVLAIRSGADAGRKGSEMAGEFKVRSSTIANIIAGKTWKHLPMAKCKNERRIGRNAGSKGEDSNAAKITEAQALEILMNLEIGGAAISRKLGVSPSIIYPILARKTWKHLSPLPESNSLTKKPKSSTSKSNTITASESAE